MDADKCCMKQYGRLMILVFNDTGFEKAFA